MKGSYYAGARICFAKSVIRTDHAILAGHAKHGRQAREYKAGRQELGMIKDIGQEKNFFVVESLGFLKVLRG